MGKLKVKSGWDAESWPKTQLKLSVDRGEVGIAGRLPDVQLAIRKKFGPFTIKVDTSTI